MVVRFGLFLFFGPTEYERGSRVRFCVFYSREEQGVGRGFGLGRHLKTLLLTVLFVLRTVLKLIPIYMARTTPLAMRA